MEHFEAAYLLSMAHRIRNWELDAEQNGGTFHPSANFVPLKDGLQAQARIKQIKGKPVFAVIVRQDLYDADDVKVVQAAKGLFTTAYTRIPKIITTDGHRDHLFYSTEVPVDPLAKRS